MQKIIHRALSVAKLGETLLSFLDTSCLCEILVSCWNGGNDQFGSGEPLAHCSLFAIGAAFSSEVNTDSSTPATVASELLPQTSFESALLRGCLRSFVALLVSSLT